MPTVIDKVFAPHLQALQVGSKRMEILAANVANADTPGYLARDIDFRAAMQQVSPKNDSMSQVTVAATSAGHISVNEPSGANFEVLYRTAVQPSLDGNTVDTERESAAVAENAVRYEAALMFFNSKIRGLRLAITGNN